jgi:adenosylcobinamide hydrolase
VWRLDPPRLACASTVVGGGIGARRWVLNAQVPADEPPADPGRFLAGLARALGCSGAGVGFLTAAPVDAWSDGASGDVTAIATVGLTHPAWAAAPPPAESASPPAAGTVNVVAFVPARLAPAALVNAVMTLTEAKTQALLEHGVPGTGTPTDAACVLAPTAGAAEPYAGPRSRLGGHLARAVHAAVAAGVERHGWTPAR